MSSWILENPEMCIKIAQDMGGVSIRSLYDKTKMYEWVHTQKKGLSSKGTYDSLYSGGFEFLFPTDEACDGPDMIYQDHGFLWTTAFEASGVIKKDNGQELTFTGIIQEMGVRVSVAFFLGDTERRIHSAITFENTNDFPVPYLFRLHPSFLLHEGSILELNGEAILFEHVNGEVRSCDFKNLQKIDFPYIETEKEKINLQDLRHCSLKEIYGHIKQNAGCFAIKDCNQKICVEYDHSELPFLTLYYFKDDLNRVVILEPATAALSNVSDYGENPAVVWLQDTKTYSFDFII